MGLMMGVELGQEAIFENAGQAVHVAFLVMAQEATQDAPLRKALIRIMESIKLDSGNQRHWLDQLRGERSGTVNFDGLSPGDIRAQCALITQAVKTNLPEIERWVLQAKYGETEFEDIPADSVSDALNVALAEAETKARDACDHVAQERKRFAAACDVPWIALTRAARPGQPAEFQTARAGFSAANHALAEAESMVQAARVALDRAGAPRLGDRGPAPVGAVSRRRWAFSAERIESIKGLSDWFAPMFPRIKPLAIDCMLGRMFANHKKLDISSRDLAQQFGGNHTQYLRASWKMKNHIRILEANAVARLEPVFIKHGVIAEIQ
ncbi:hypothetical protein HHL21_14465 [Massilia sp. RP-1-19]|uniref:Uncharacterized protein n=1 Tax=Massilia polaris TaxID=2728846 RepID=A0A848HMM7_9BURK|nr:hypothetical protein [Massilia polaris]NML62257.1 hypothetical protein [Massilia polaris]